MAKALFVTYLVALSIGLAASYAEECAVGPDYWCKSFENAQDCGAIPHCTDTVWSNDNKYALVDSSTRCQWCQKILGNAQQGLEDDENLAIYTLSGTCNLMSSDVYSSKCLNAIENYGTSVISLMKNKRFATLCRLMNICSNENPSIIVGNKRCTWGPSYWCSSLSNSRECSSIDHCSNQIWSQQSIKKSENDNICQYCEYIIDKLRSIISENKSEIDVEKWLAGACSMLQTQDKIDQCVQTMSHYAEEILVLIKNNIDSGLICHLGEMCKDVTIIPRVKSNDQESKMLCNVIVHATYELHVNQEKNQNEIEIFLKNDCQKLSNTKLQEKCENLVEQYGNEIYGHVTNNMESSTICDTFDVESRSHVHCDLCTFALTAAKSMIDMNNADDKVLGYIDENFCSNLKDDLKKNCKIMIENNGKDLINEVKQGRQPMLLCAYFQVCYDEVVDGTSPIEKDEIHSFLKENICDHLGIFQDSCNALLKKDSTSLFKTLANDIQGDVLCQIFGICAIEMSFIDNFLVNDDQDKCQRCVDDFTRRKQIAETLLNSSSTFLHHFCGQLPQEDECIKAVDESINQLIQVVQSISPKDICMELKMCTENSLENIRTTLPDNIISEQVILYIKNEVCSRIGPLSNLCDHLMNTEGTDAFNQISEDIDPHKVCSVIDICPATTAFENCNDKCECCVSKVENYQVQIAAFLETMLRTTGGVCEYMSDSEDCRAFAVEFKWTIDEIMSTFNAKKICQTLTHCSVSLVDTCSTCVQRLDLKKDGILQGIDRLAGYFDDICQEFSGKKCQKYIKQIKDFFQQSLEEFETKQICNSIGFCGIDKNENEMDFDEFENYLEDKIKQDICSILGPFENLCQNIIQGNTKQIQELKMNYNIEDVMKIGEELTDISSDMEDINHKDKCQCCIGCVTRRKWRTKFIGDKIFSTLLHSCSYCPSKQQCRKHWQVAKKRFDTNIDKVCPKRVCTHLGYCNKTDKHEIEEIKSIDNSNSTCILCDYVMNILSNYIHSQSTEEEMEDNLQKICDQIPSILQNQCREYIDNYGPAIISILIREFDLSTVCQKLNLCTNEMKYDITHILKADTATCGICDYISTYIHFALERDSNEHSLQHALSTVCTYLSDEQKPKCQTIIQLVSPFIRQLKLNPGNNFCKELTICEVPMIETRPGISLNKEPLIVETFPKETVKQGSISETPTCSLCEYMVTYLVATLKTNASEEAIEEALKEACTILPGSLRAECDQFVTTYGSVIAELIAGSADPNTICRYLGLCQYDQTTKTTTVVAQTSYTCLVCQYTINRMKYFSGLNQNKNEILVSVKNSCDLFTVTNLQEQCKQFLDQHGAYLSRNIFDQLEPRSACQTIGICYENQQESASSTLPSLTLVNTGKCIFGINYWCTSRATAELCNAIDICERQVWSKTNIVIN